MARNSDDGNGAIRPASRTFAWSGVNATLAIMVILSGQSLLHAQQVTPVPAPVVPPAAVTNQELLEELRRLKAEVQEASQLREEVRQLRAEVAHARSATGGLPGPNPAAGNGLPGGQEPGLQAGPTNSPPGTQFNGLPDRYHSGAFGPATGEKPDADRYPIKGEYKYNHNATGPLGGGGYFSLSTRDDEFTVNLSNQITVDGTFMDRQNLPTSEQGFNVPFARTFLYGNITKDWSYQVGTQGFLGSFNLLDLWMSWHINDRVTLRAGKGLAPPLYEYYAFSPALEPVITNSPLFQIAAKRPIGFMFTGTLFDNRIQWWSGVTNSGTSLFGSLDRNVDYNGAVDFTPFRGEQWAGTIWEGLGGGMGFSSGWQQYLLKQEGNSFTNNGEATTNSSFVTVVGLPFYVYNPNVSAFGMQTRAAPHVYWFGRFSVLAEYMNFSRVLTDGSNIGRSTQRGYYVNASYWLTGERDYQGNGFQAYSTVEPLNPFIPSRGLYGPGAWQIASQWSQFDAGTGDIARGFVNTRVSTNRMDSFMVGVNWWPNKYTRLSFDYVLTNFNNPIPLSGGTPLDGYQTFWTRFAMFF